MLELLKRPEILAPAGSQVCLRAALNAGATAIYFGVQGFNMRAGAKNFPVESMGEVVAQCHEKLASAYLALNTIQFEREIPEMRKVLEAAAKAGVDGVICWDPAVIMAAKEFGLQPHLSTQASVSNSQGVLFYYRNFGIRRFVLAREVTMEDMIAMRHNLTRELSEKAAEIELEVFAHGAMCVSVSGRCFMSEHTFGHSGNRGDCLQPCRREFKISDVDDESEYIIGQDYVLSPEDLCTLPFIDQLIHAGVDSLKIEGRNRNPEYVHTTVSAYRKAVDYYFDNYGKSGFDVDFAKLKEDLLEELHTVYNRGFSNGFYMGKPMDAWTRYDGSKATRKKDFVGLISNYYGKIGVAEIKIQSNEFEVGDEIMLQGPTTGVFSQVVTAIEVDHERVHKAAKGTSVAVQMNERVRVNDQVYIWRDTPERAE